MSSTETPLALAGEIEEVRSEIREHRSWFMGLGVLLLVLGIAAIAFPFATTVAVKVMVGWLFLIGGIAEIFQAFSMKNWKSLLGNLLVGGLYVVVGIWLSFFPLTGIISLTLLLALVFILEGAVKLAMAFKLKPMEGWGWVLFSAIIAISAGVLLVAGLPGTAAWAIGLLVGVNLLGAGMSYLMITMAAGKT
ncbi:acid-resistance membrane protein [Roseibium album]|nr:acid-resistance membrane protein [Roseibium album]